MKSQLQSVLLGGVLLVNNSLYDAVASSLHQAPYNNIKASKSMLSSSSLATKKATTLKRLTRSRGGIEVDPQDDLSGATLIEPLFLHPNDKRGGLTDKYLPVESDLDRGKYLAKVYSVIFVQLAIMTAASYRLLTKAPPELQQFLRGDKMLLQTAGVCVAGKLVSIGLLSVATPIRQIFPLNLLALLLMTANQGMFLAAISKRFATRAPTLAAAQAALTTVILSLIAPKAWGEGFLPYAVAAGVCLLPARGVSLLLDWPVREVMTGGAFAFILSLLIIFTSQVMVKGRAHQGAFEGAAELWVDMARLLFRTVSGVREEKGGQIGGRGRKK